MSKVVWERRLKLLQFLIVRHHAQTAEVANYLGVDRRTALADLKVLAEHGVPLIHPSLGNDAAPTDRDTFWRLDSTWAAMGLKSNFVLRLAVLLGREVVSHYLRDTEFSRAVTDLEQKIAALTTEEFGPDLGRRFFLKQEPAKKYGDQDELLSDLAVALVNRAPISFNYTSASGRTSRYEHEFPVTLVMYRRGLYVALYRPRPRATNHGQGKKVVALAIDRMRDLDLHSDPDDAFTYPPASEYDPNVHFKDIFGIFDDGSPAQDVVLRFPAEGSQAYVREREWMPGQVLSFAEDGSMEVRFRARGAELPFRILEYGPFCEVLAPLELRERVAQLARDTAALYTESPAPSTPTTRRPRRIQA
jgi:predicted DNA-binding transcriptional regulator YafY